MEGDHEPDQFKLFADSEAMVLGRKSYEGFAEVWPTMAGDGRWADRINPMPKYVASKSLKGRLKWNAKLIKGDVVEGIESLKSELTGNLFTSGCGSFARFLATNGLIDEAWFWVHPIVWSKGATAFHDGPPIKMELLGSKKYESGVTLLRYRPIPSSASPR